MSATTPRSSLVSALAEGASPLPLPEAILWMQNGPHDIAARRYMSPAQDVGGPPRTHLPLPILLELSFFSALAPLALEAAAPQGEYAIRTHAAQCVAVLVACSGDGVGGRGRRGGRVTLWFG